MFEYDLFKNSVSSLICCFISFSIDLALAFFWHNVYLWNKNRSNISPYCVWNVSYLIWIHTGLSVTLSRFLLRLTLPAPRVMPICSCWEMFHPMTRSRRCRVCSHATEPNQHMDKQTYRPEGMSVEGFNISPSPLLVSPVVGCTGWSESEGSSRSPPLAARTTESPEPASTTYTDSSREKEIEKTNRFNCHN